MRLPFKFYYKSFLIITIALFVYLLFYAPLKIFILSFIEFNRGNKTIKDLEKENYYLKLQQEAYRRWEKEKEVLYRILNIKKEKNIEIIVGTLIFISPLEYERSVWIDIGNKEGVREGMYVVDDEKNIIGKVGEVLSSRSKVILLEDPNFYIPVFINDNIGLLRGSLKGYPQIMYIDKDKRNTLNIGEEVLFKDMEHKIDFYVGKIKRIEDREDDLFLYIEIEPSYRLYKLERVFVVK